jgi:hypothetical protein
MPVIIKVFSSNLNNFARGKKVSLHDSVGTRSGTTDSSGTVQFPTAKSGNYTVYVEGHEVYKGPIVGVQIVNI